LTYLYYQKSIFGGFNLQINNAGSVIGTIVGIGLLGGGLIGAISGRFIPGVGGLIAGAVTIASNMISLKKRANIFSATLKGSALCKKQRVHI